MRTEEIMETAKDRAGQKEIIRAVTTGAAGSPDGDGGAAMETIPVVVTGGYQLSGVSPGAGAGGQRL